MSPDAQRIAIALAHGFKWFAWWHTESHITIPLNRLPVESDYQRTTFPPTRFLVPVERPAGFGEFECSDMSMAIDKECFRYVPDYLKDLNAMHEAEVAVIYPRSLAMVYLNILQDIANERSPAKFDDTNRTLYCSSATAAQRAEAFLCCLFLWDDCK